MPSVRMYSDVEGDAEVGDVVEVSEERARLLVIGGKATHVDPTGGEHLPPVGGLRVVGTTIGIDADGDVLEAVLTPESQRDTELEFQTADEVQMGGLFEAPPEPDPEPDPDPEP